MRAIYLSLTLGILLTERLVYKDNQFNVWVWILVIINSLVTSTNYIMLMVNTWSTIRSSMTLGKGVMSTFLFVGGLLSSYTWLLILWQAHTVVMEADLDVESYLLFYLAALARSLHCILGGKLSASVHCCRYMMLVCCVLYFSDILCRGRSYVRNLGCQSSPSPYPATHEPHAFKDPPVLPLDRSHSNLLPRGGQLPCACGEFCLQNSWLGVDSDACSLASSLSSNH